MYIHTYTCTCLYINIARTHVQDPDVVAPYLYRYMYIYIYIHVYIYMYMYICIAQTHVPDTDVAVPNWLTKKKNLLYLCVKHMRVKDDPYLDVSWCVIHICVRNQYTYDIYTHTGWRRLIGSPKLQIIFHKRATKYRALLLKMTCKIKGSYGSSPPCMQYMTRIMRRNTWYEKEKWYLYDDAALFDMLRLYLVWYVFNSHYLSETNV